MDSDITYEKDFTLFKTSDYLGIKKTISLTYDVDMLVEVTALYPDSSTKNLMNIEMEEISKIAQNDIA